MTIDENTSINSTAWQVSSVQPLFSRKC